MKRVALFAGLGDLLAVGAFAALSVTASEPRLVAQFEKATTNKYKLWMICWSADEKQIYVQGIEDSRDEAPRRAGFLVNLADGSFQPVADTPTWARDYWDIKSSDSSPDGNETVVQVSSRVGGRDNVVFRLGALKLGEGERHANPRGYSYAWGPAGTGVVAFLDADANVMVARQDGRDPARLLEGKFTLPAFSPTATKLAIGRERSGRWELYVCDLRGLTLP